MAMSALPLRIFVSHSHLDDDFGARLVSDLRRSLGSNDAVWYDTSGGLQPGDDWWDTIVKELTTRPIFLVLLSDAAMQSPWVNDEIKLAWRQKNDPMRGKLIIPVLYRSCSVREDLKALQMVSFLPPHEYEQGFRHLLSALGLGTGPTTNWQRHANLDGRPAPLSATRVDTSYPTQFQVPAVAKHVPLLTAVVQQRRTEPIITSDTLLRQPLGRPMRSVQLLSKAARPALGPAFALGMCLSVLFGLVFLLPGNNLLIFLWLVGLLGCPSFAGGLTMEKAPSPLSAFIAGQLTLFVWGLFFIGVGMGAVILRVQNWSIDLLMHTILTIVALLGFSAVASGILGGFLGVLGGIFGPGSTKPRRTNHVPRNI